jgi:hypothetical protein
MRQIIHSLTLGIIVCMFLFTACSGGSGGSSVTTINGISVPPEPDVTQNKVSVAGIDSNFNGVRDDVERIVAAKFGGVGDKYTEALNHAKAEQSLIISENSNAVNTYIQTVACSKLSVDESDSLTKIQLDTRERRMIYAQKLAGKVSEGCKQ